VADFLDLHPASRSLRVTRQAGALPADTLLLVSPPGHARAPAKWEAKASWFGPRLHCVSFVAVIGHLLWLVVWWGRARLGPAGAGVVVGFCTILVWDEDLLAWLG
jgi:hypothetical protein